MIFKRHNAEAYCFTACLGGSRSYCWGRQLDGRTTIGGDFMQKGWNSNRYWAHCWTKSKSHSYYFDEE